MSTNPPLDRPEAKRCLDAVIADAWSVFDVPRPETVGVCTRCCMRKSTAEAFLKHTPKTLTFDLLREWFSSAEADLRYEHVAWLIPRIMEELAKDGWNADIFFYGSEVALRRLPHTGFPAYWPDRAVRIVERYADALLEVRLARYASRSPEFRDAMDPDLEATLCTLAEGGLPQGRFLARLERLPEPVLIDLLRIQMVSQSPSYPPSPEELNAFWGEPGRTKWWQWLTSEKMLDRMEKAARAGHEAAAEVAAAIRAVRAGRS